jgi:cyclase
MLKSRLIPILLVDQNRLVKTTQFTSPKYVGDPINTIRIFNEKEVDELMIFDISASKYGREPNYELLEQMASECFMPVCYGGGISKVEQANRLFQIGIEKISLRASAINNSDFISELAKRFGSQAIVASFDIIGNNSKNYKLIEIGKDEYPQKHWMEYLKDVVGAGAGEILLTCVEREGLRNGLAIDLIQEASKELSVPLIAQGGLGSIEHAQEALLAGADAVAGGSFFVFHGKHKAVLISYPTRNALNLLLANQT